MACAPCEARRRGAQIAARDARVAAEIAGRPAPDSGRVYDLVDQQTGQVTVTGGWAEVKAAQRAGGGMIRSRRTTT